MTPQPLNPSSTQPTTPHRAVRGRFLALASSFFALVVLLLACDGERPGIQEPKGADRKVLLTGGSTRGWRITQYIARGRLVDAEPCRADDDYTFKISGDFSIVNNLRCNENDLAVISGRWKFNADTTLLTLTSLTSAYEVTYTVIAVNDVQLHMAYNDPFNGYTELFLTKFY